MRKAYNSNALFGHQRKSSMAQNTPLNNFGNYPKNEVNDTQRTLRSNLKILKIDVAHALKLHDRWQSEADPSTRDKKAKYIKPLSEMYIKGLRSLVQTTKKVYNAQGSMMRKAPQVTVFDYDDNYHILSVNLLRVLSLWYSTLSFIKDDTYAIGKELRPLISNVHTLFVLATSKNYFGNAVAMYHQNPKSDWKNSINESLLREVKSNKYTPFLTVGVINRFLRI